VTHFEAAACGAPLISDRWPGFEQFFTPGTEALTADSRDDILAALELPDHQRRRIGEAARRRVLTSHTYVQRVDELEHLLGELGLSPRDRANKQPAAAGAASTAGTSEAA
jgi:spore maturation protein CgeB